MRKRLLGAFWTSLAHVCSTSKPWLIRALWTSLAHVSYTSRPWFMRVVWASLAHVRFTSKHWFMRALRGSLKWLMRAPQASHGSGELSEQALLKWGFRASLSCELSEQALTYANSFAKISLTPAIRASFASKAVPWVKTSSEKLVFVFNASLANALVLPGVG